MKHFTEILGTETARLIIEWRPSTKPSRRPFGGRHCIDQRGSPVFSRGAVLGFNSGKPCILVLTVMRGDLVSLAAPDSANGWHHYRISPDFELQAFPIHDRKLTPDELNDHVNLECCEQLEQLGDCDDALRDFLDRKDRPDFVSQALARQIRKWRKRRPDKFFHFVPSLVKESEIPFLANIAPFTGLRFFRKRMTEKQILRCIHRSPEGGVLFAFERMTPAQIERAIKECPGTLITHRHSRISDKQLDRCAQYDPFAAIKTRAAMNPRRHAILLARSYSLAFPMQPGGTMDDFHAEIIGSLTRFPDVWLSAHQHDYDEIFECLSQRAQIRIDHGFIQTLLGKISIKHRKHLADHIAKFL